MLIDRYGNALVRDTDRPDDGRTGEERTSTERMARQEGLCSPELFDQVIDAGMYLAFSIKKGVGTSSAKKRIERLRRYCTGE